MTKKAKPKLPAAYRGLGLTRAEGMRIARLEAAIDAGDLHPHAIYYRKNHKRIARIMEGKG